MSNRERRDPYIVLGVARQASGEEIARAYRRAARASHPDSGSGGSAERFQAVSDAYEVLRDPRRRAVYDRSHPLASPRTPGGRGGSVRYAAPGSQHLVLGRQTQSESEVAHPRSPVEHREIEQMFRLALSLLRARW
jgi:curved DNA-binding protein CbpA